MKKLKKSAALQYEIAGEMSSKEYAEAEKLASDKHPILTAVPDYLSATSSRNIPISAIRGPAWDGKVATGHGFFPQIGVHATTPISVKRPLKIGEMRKRD